MRQLSKSPARVSHLPAQLTSFIGRTNEINEIVGLLLDPACPLLTLVGPGGVGKTRLAIQAAAEVEAGFAHGVFFVNLQPVQSTDFLISAIADALHFPLAGQGEPATQLLHYLRDKALLLVLDNFEQLLEAGGREFLLQLLQTTPQVKLLVTSREVLNLQGEWLYPLHGLAFPTEREFSLPQAEKPEAYEAVQLFVDRARRIRPDFSLRDEMAGVVRLCQLVEGVPLALELAASWIKALSCAEVVAEIQHSLDFLVTPLHNVPERHRSMQAVFVHAWQRLSPEEQETLSRLSVFRGGFLRTAAEAITGTTLSLLTSLVDKSLLRWEPDRRRYQIHELLRQFCEEQLTQAPETLAHVRDLHANYYLTFLGDCFEALTGERQEGVLAEIGAERDNIRAAWRWAISQGYSSALEYGAMGLHTFYQYRGHFVEGAEAFATAVRATAEAPSSPERDRALAVLLNCAGWLEMRLGRVQEATQMQEKALALYEALGLLPAPGQGTDPLIALSMLAMTRGDYEQAMSFGQQAWQRAVTRSDHKNMAMAGYGLINGLMAWGNYETALQVAQETLALTKSAGNRWLMAYIYSQLGRINQVLGDLSAAGDYYRASYSLKEALNDPEGMALALNYLGEIALAQDAYQQAHDLYQQSLTIYQEIGDRGGLVRALQGLGMAAHGLGHEPAARSFLRQALQGASEAQIAPLILSVLIDVGTYLIESGNLEQGTATLAFIQHHPASDQMMKAKVDQLLEAHQAVMVTEPGPYELDTLIPTLLAELATPLTLAGNLPVPQPDHAPDQPPIDPLSERELEVLRLMAEGLTNRQIAERLFVVLGTVKAHTSNIYSKLGVSNRTQAVTRAQVLKLL